MEAPLLSGRRELGEALFSTLWTPALCGVCLQHMWVLVAGEEGCHWSSE